MPISPSIFSEINQIIEEDIKDELRLQGHKAFGNLERSFTRDELFLAGDIVLEGRALRYIEELEHGVEANDIGNVNFDELVRWVRLRGMAKDHSAVQVAYYIIKKWKQEGKPSSVSKGFSQTGEILNAVNITLDSWREKYDRMFAVIIDKELQNQFNAQVKSGVV